MATRYRRHTLDIYGAELYLATDLGQWKSLRRKIDSLEEDPGGVGATSLDMQDAELDPMNTAHLSVYIDKATLAEDGGALVNTCAHEAAHAAALLLDHLGQEPGNSEALAYLTGWITQWIWEGCAA